MSLLKLLHFLPDILGLLVLALAIYLAYRYFTRDTRTAPKRALQKELNRLRFEDREAQVLMESLVDTAKLWKDTEPNMADTVIFNISEHRSARAKRDKEPNK